MWQAKIEYAFTSQLSNYIPTPYREVVLKRDKETCVFCGRPANNLCHLVPKSRGGKTIPFNLAVCCPTCRKQKNRSLPLEFINQKILPVKDILEVKRMKVKVIYQDGSQEIGQIEKFPSPSDNGFYFYPNGNGAIQFISIHAIKKVVQGND